jgi:hypothetical protein
VNNTLTTAPGRLDHQHQPSSEYQYPVRRVSLFDRLALHLGVALVAWGRRPLAVESRERRASRVEQHLARLERERFAERTLRLSVPLR